MKLIVGLGNPGEKYLYTRHNIGFMIVDLIAKTLGVEFKLDKKFKGEVAKTDSYIFLKPQTFMNLSGDSVRLIADFYKIEPKDILVIHDDLDFEVGEVKKQFARGSAGHNGVSDIINKLGTNEFYRIRVGIGSNDQVSSEDYVLRNISKEDLKNIQSQINLEDVLNF